MSEHDHGHGEHGHDEHEYHSHGALYFAVFGALLVFTAISYVADKLVNFGVDKKIIVCVVMAVAVCKALCVMMYFMHLKFERAWKYLLLAPTFVLAFTIPFALAPDIGWHYYTSTAPQIEEYESQQAKKAAGHDDHAPEAPANH